MTDAELTILSLVAEGARYGHEIQQLIDERGLREWVTIGFSSVYYILNKLEEQNLLISSLEKRGHRGAHKAYEVTEAGRGILQTAISDLLRQPRSLGTGFELGLVNLAVLKPRQVYSVLSHHRQDLQQRLGAVEKSWQDHQENDSESVTDHISALYTHSIALMSSELEWIEAFLENWRQRYPAVDNPNESNNNLSDPHSDPTRVHYRPSRDPAQMIQRLKRLRPPSEEEEADS